MRTATLVLAALLALPSAQAGLFSREPSSEALLARAWPEDPAVRVNDIGRGIGIVFTPDLSVDGNCRFYESLGFACFQDADWTRVIDGIRRYNQQKPERQIRTLVLETHGTNGHGLRIQVSKNPKAERSYISVGALQEQVEPLGVRYIVLSACNSGRLLRPMIYTSLDPNPGDKLFLPATCGIVNASWQFQPRRSRVTVLTPKRSHIETTLAASVHELTPRTRKLIAQSAKKRGLRAPAKFVISDVVMALLLRDSANVALTVGKPVQEMSKDILPAAESEKLFDRFTAHLDRLAKLEQPAAQTASRTPAKTRGTR